MWLGSAAPALGFQSPAAFSPAQAGRWDRREHLPAGFEGVSGFAVTPGTFHSAPRSLLFLLPSEFGPRAGSAGRDSGWERSLSQAPSPPTRWLTLEVCPAGAAPLLKGWKIHLGFAKPTPPVAQEVFIPFFPKAHSLPGIFLVLSGGHVNFWAVFRWPQSWTWGKKRNCHLLPWCAWGQQHF